jgi:hypothetical protein
MRNWSELEWLGRSWGIGNKDQRSFKFTIFCVPWCSALSTVFTSKETVLWTEEEQSQERGTGLKKNRSES